MATAMEGIRSDYPWRLYTTSNGTLLYVDGKNATVVLTGLAERLEAAGLDGVITASENSFPELSALMKNAVVPASAVLAYTIHPPYEVGPFNEFGVVLDRWGLDPTFTATLGRTWVDWVVPSNGPADIGKIQVDPDDAFDVFATKVERLTQPLLLLGHPTGTPITRAIGIRPFGEVMITESGTPITATEQAGRILREFVLPHVADLDYATVRMTNPSANNWTTGDSAHGNTWQRGVRHLWSQYVADPNAIQILTDAHLDKATNLDQWQVTRVAPGRWLVQANDLPAWFEHIDRDKAQRRHQYLHPDLLAQARLDFGHMILNHEIAAAMKARPQ